MIVLIGISFILWMYWIVFFKEKYNLRVMHRKVAATIAKNTQELQNIDQAKKNKIEELEKRILYQYEKNRNYIIPEIMLNASYTIDELIKEYINLTNFKQSSGYENNELNKIIADYYSRMTIETRRHEVLLKQKMIEEKREQESKRKIEETKISESERSKTEERYKKMSSKALDSEAMAWYELQAEIKRGK